MSKITTCLLICINLWHIDAGQDVVGCGGFIKSPAATKLAYNRISIQLTLLDGSLRYMTEVLPNGAYSMPVYDPGDYVLKVDAPEGWGFEPAQGHLITVQSRDSCVEDYNFQFTGFSIYGQVITKNLNTGPSGIGIRLINANDQTIAQSQTASTGHIHLANILPGDYRLMEDTLTSAQPHQFQFEKKEIKVIVTTDNVKLNTPLTIKGFSVFGKVTSDNEPVKGVRFLLFSEKIKSNNLEVKAIGCLSEETKTKLHSYQNHPLRDKIILCEVISNQDGLFEFKVLPGGDYKVAPFYRSEKLVFDVEPSALSFSIVDRNVDLGNAFQVAGFSVSGRVLLKKNSNEGVPNANVVVNGKEVTVTDKKGVYHLDSVKSGQYTVEVKLPQIQFTSLNIQLTPNSPVLPDIVASKFACCGQVIVDSNVNQHTSEPRTISVLDQQTSKEVIRVQTEGNHGEFCVLLPAGKYTVRPVVTDVEAKSLGLRLAPNEIKVTVTDKIIRGLKFSQFRAKVSGKVKCLEKCPTGQLEVTLTPDEDTGGQAVTQHIKVDKSSSTVGEFLLNNVMPGSYQLELHAVKSTASTRNNWCWKSVTLPVTVQDHDVADLLLEHVGYVVTVVTSHPLNLKYKEILHNADSNAKAMHGENELGSGTHQVCLPKPGKYSLSAKSCHKLERSEFEFSTESFGPSDTPAEINIVASEHQVKIQFATESAEAARYITDLRALTRVVPDENTPEPANLPVTKFPVKFNPETLVGELQLWVKPGQETEIRAESNLALISPLSVTVSSSGENCLPLAAKFEVKLGVFIKGEINPPIKDVNVTIAVSEPNSVPTQELSYENQENVIHLQTDGQGKFSKGPLSRDQTYTVKVEKLGYVFDQVGTVKETSTSQTWTYRAQKLAEVVVTAIDEGEQPLPGVLLSIVGDNYRSNQLTNENGVYVFLGLSPGTYYVRALMKEYEFTPSGAQSISVEEGRSVSLKVRGVRSAYSVMGIVISLTGDPESGVLMEARELGPTETATAQEKKRCFIPDKNGKTRAEQGVSDDNGEFRIRGLWPGCRYEIYLKLEAGGVNQLIERAVPSNFIIDMQAKDREGFKVYAFRRISMMEINAIVRTSSDEFLSSLRLTVFPAAEPDLVLARHNFATDSLLFTMNSQSVVPSMTETSPNNAKRSYVIRLESVLSRMLYTNISAQELAFTIPHNTNDSHHNFVFHFYPVRKTVADPDQNLSLISLINLPLMLCLAGFLFFNRDRCIPQALTFLDSAKRFLFNISLTGTNSKFRSSARSETENVDLSGLSDLNNFVAKPGQTAAQQSSGPVKRIWSRSRKT